MNQSIQKPFLSTEILAERIPQAQETSKPHKKKTLEEDEENCEWCSRLRTALD